MIADSLTCPGCKAQLRHDAGLEAGAAVRCPRCGGDFALPADPGCPKPMLAPPPRQAPAPDEDEPAWGYTKPPPGDEGIDDLDGAGYEVAIGRWLREGFRHWPTMARVVLAHLLISLLAGSLIAVVIPYLGPLIVALLALPVAQGPMIVALAVAARRQWALSELFAGFQWYPAFLGFYGVVGLLSMACFVPVLAVAIWADRASWLWSPARRGPDPTVLLALFVGAAFLSFSLVSALHARLATFGPQLIIERDCGPLAAIRGSWRLSRGHFWGLCAFNLVLWLINLAGLATCYVGVVLTLPLTQLASAAAYLDAVGKLPGRADAHRQAPDD